LQTVRHRFNTQVAVLP